MLVDVVSAWGKWVSSVGLVSVISWCGQLQYLLLSRTSSSLIPTLYSIFRNYVWCIYLVESSASDEYIHFFYSN